MPATSASTTPASLIPEFLSFHRKHGIDLPIRRSDPYIEIISPAFNGSYNHTTSSGTSTQQPPTKISIPLHPQHSKFPDSSLSSESINQSPNSLPPLTPSRFPKLSRRRLPPDSENEVPSVRRRAVRSIRYGIRPRTGAVATNSSGSYRYPMAQYIEAPALVKQQQLPYRQNQWVHEPVYGPQQLRGRHGPSPPDVLPRLATARFTKIASYHLSHLLALAKRRLQGGAAPLPITIDKAMMNQAAGPLPYPGPGVEGNRIASGMMAVSSGRPAYHDGMWPSPAGSGGERLVVSQQQRQHAGRRYHQPTRSAHRRPYVRHVKTNQPSEAATTWAVFFEA